MIETASYFEGDYKIEVAGNGSGGMIGAYAAVLEDSISGVILVTPPKTHMDAAAPQFLNVLRVCDVPNALGLIAPRLLTIVGASADDFECTKAAYEAAGVKARLVVK